MATKKINDLDAISRLTKSVNYAIPILDLNDRDADGDPKLKQVPINLLQSLFKNETKLATVATSGKYGDLKNLPQLFSGDYADLSGKPDIPARTSELQNDSGFLTQHQDISEKVNRDELATVATTGSYADLSGKPETTEECSRTLMLATSGDCYLHIKGTDQDAPSSEFSCDYSADSISVRNPPILECIRAFLIKKLLSNQGYLPLPGTDWAEYINDNDNAYSFYSPRKRLSHPNGIYYYSQSSPVAVHLTFILGNTRQFTISGRGTGDDGFHAYLYGKEPYSGMEIECRIRLDGTNITIHNAVIDNTYYGTGIRLIGAEIVFAKARSVLSPHDYDEATPLSMIVSDPQAWDGTQITWEGGIYGDNRSIATEHPTHLLFFQNQDLVAVQSGFDGYTVPPSTTHTIRADVLEKLADDTDTTIVMCIDSVVKYISEPIHLVKSATE